MHKSFDENIREMKSLGRLLLPYSFPLVSHQDEADIAILKKREIIVDGYEVIVYFNNAQYGDKILESLQIYGKEFSFLPFVLVCKIAKSFLGSEKLSLAEIMHSTTAKIDNSCRKIYVWTLYYDMNENRIDSPFQKNVKLDSFEGLDFFRIQNKDVNFF